MKPVVRLEPGAFAKWSASQLRSHSAADASRLAALLVGQILPVFSLLASCGAGASTTSVRDRKYETDHSAFALVGCPKRWRRLCNSPDVISPSHFRLDRRHRQCVGIFASVLLVSASTAIAQRRSPPVLVRYVVDGDTIDVAAVGRVRLLGIDAPEIGRGLDASAPFAVEAQQRLAGLIAQRWVRLEYEGRTSDSYHRRLAYVFLETGQFVNELLVREGLARVVARRGSTRLGELKRAEAEAQASRRGIWGHPPVLPSETYRLPRRRLKQ